MSAWSSKPLRRGDAARIWRRYTPGGFLLTIPFAAKSTMFSNYHLHVQLLRTQSNVILFVIMFLCFHDVYLFLTNIDHCFKTEFSPGGR